MSVSPLNTRKIHTVLLSSLGGCLEFYDFVIFGVFASAIGHTFFPSKNHFISLMAAFTAFGVGYLARPIGGILFSHFGDRYGRKPTFMFSIRLMAVSTLCIGLLPSYSTLGVTAAILFVLLRLIQGAAIGGEIPGAATFIAEHCPQNRGFACGMLMLFINAGILLAVMLHSLLSLYLSPSYAWRIAFIMGSVLALISYFIRKSLQESPEFQQLDAPTKTPIALLFKEHTLTVIQGSSLIMLQAIGISLFYLYIVSYMQFAAHHYSTLQISQLTTINVMIMTVGCGVWGWISDYFPPKRLLYISIIALPLLGLWFYQTVNTDAHPMLAYALLSVFFGMFAGSALSWLTCLFPVKVRFSGVAICYNLSFAIFGGLSPLLATYFINIYHNTLIPAWLVAIVAPFTLLGCIYSRARDTASTQQIR